MEPMNKVEMRGRVGSHIIALRDDGYWEGQFDLHVITKDMHGFPQALCFDCRITEENQLNDLDIGGKIVQLRGRLIRFPETDHDGYYILVKHLTVVGGPMDKLDVPDLAEKRGGDSCMRSSSIPGSGGSRVTSTTSRRPKRG